MFPIIRSSGKCKLKQQCGTITHLLELPELRTTPNPGKDVSNRNPRSLLVEMQNDTVWEDSWAVSYKIKPTLTTSSQKKKREINNFIAQGTRKRGKKPKLGKKEKIKIKIE